MTSSTSPVIKDDASTKLPEASGPDAAKKDEATKTPAVSNDKK